MNAHRLNALRRGDGGLCTPCELLEHGGRVFTLDGDELREDGTTTVAGWYGIDAPAERPVYVTEAGVEFVVIGRVEVTS